MALPVDAVVQEPNGVRDATLRAVARGGALCSIPDWHPTAVDLIANRGRCSIPDGSRFQKGEPAGSFSSPVHVVFALFVDPCRPTFVDFADQCGIVL